MRSSQNRIVMYNPLGTHYQKKIPLVRFLGGFCAALPAPTRLAPSGGGAFGGRGRLSRPSRGCLGGSGSGAGAGIRPPPPPSFSCGVPPPPPCSVPPPLVAGGACARGVAAFSSGAWAFVCPPLPPPPPRPWLARLCLHLYSPVFTFVFASVYICIRQCLRL